MKNKKKILSRTKSMLDFLKILRKVRKKQTQGSLDFCLFCLLTLE